MSRLRKKTSPYFVSDQSAADNAYAGPTSKARARATAAPPAAVTAAGRRVRAPSAARLHPAAMHKGGSQSW